ncbi:MAG: NAD-glutamate dehydrogenase [candidate division KSB1 bacterium]|nr:NAD-glutamate dehydrogenase [candidate division KSB1 bacterium]MDZ7400647.1 NAD-glutamate dehydrogenase [candidate division KSB1 bacterium]
MEIYQEASQATGLSVNDVKKIEELILRKGTFSQERVKNGLYTFFCKIGMVPYYFQTTPIETIANHIESLLAAEVIAINRGSNQLDVDFVSEREDSAMYFVNDDHYKAVEIERRLERLFPAYRLQSYRTPGIDLESHFRSYFASRPDYVQPDAAPTETDIHKVAAKQFLASVPEETKERYQSLLKKSIMWNQPYIEVTEEVRGETRFMISVPQNGAYRFLSGISDIINYYGLVSNHKYAEPFSNGKLIISVYLDAEKTKPHIDDMVTDISLIYVNPENELSPLIRSNTLSVHEAFYARGAWKFTHQFLTSFTDEYMAIWAELKDRPELVDILSTMRTRLVKDSYTESRIVQTIFSHPAIIKKLYAQFEDKFNPHKQSSAQLEPIDIESVGNEIDRVILQSFVLFNDVVLKTNFYKRNKTSLAFRLDPSKFLDPIEYKEKPYGVFMILAKEMRGFHVRFRDIARGGIRIVKSRDQEDYDKNSDSIFDENYNLAFTQQKKNKDIPEGGSKGTILLNLEYQDKGELAFEKYIDGLLDVILPDESIKDYFGKEEILFLGPDEGTAELMSWASWRAKQRGYKFWKAISTGKPVSEGGIPHDLYGMTTNSVHEYVLGILNKLGIKEENITKAQTGGPDGDLGSNEILISKDKTLCVIDGSGVLYDPEGIDRAELTRLAKKRVMVEHFDKNKLSKKGFFVHINDRNVKLPDGTLVESGLAFRNTFHLNPILKADLFVPCGGRPNSVNIQNWKQMLDENGAPRFKYIVEGANLFLTQQARLELEKKGVIIFKDASANKGGVTSSSLEVLASLALTDEEYERLMCVKDGVIPEFRKNYVNDVIGIIRENARLEFEVIWKENQKSKTPMAILSDQLSDKINKVTDSIHRSDLFDDLALRKAVIERHCPAALVKLLGIDEILARVPENYQRAIVSSWLASHFIYEFGLDADEIDFHSFLRRFAC